jgi:nucleotide-binding universal stress UspA family protein
MDGFNNILIAISSPRSGRNALSRGIALARATNSRAQVLLLMHDSLGLESWQLALPSLKAIYEEEDRMRRKAEKTVAAVVAEHCGPAAAVPVTTAGGPPLKEILRFVKEHKVDLVVLSAHAESGLEQHLFGKLNEEIHRRLPCSVLFVKQEPVPLKRSICLKENRLQVCEMDYQ